MKPIEQSGHAIYNILTNDADVAAIVEGKVRPYAAGPNDSAPFIIYSTKGTPIQSKDGNSDMAQVLCTVEMYHTTVSGLVDLCNKVRLALDGKSGIYNNVVVKSLSFDDEQGNFAESAELEGVYTHQHDYMMWVEVSATVIDQMTTIANLVDSAGGFISATEIPTGGEGNVIAPDGVVNLKKSNGSTLRSVSTKSNGSVNETIANSTAIVKDSAGNVLSINPILAESSSEFSAPDSTVNLNGAAFQAPRSGQTIDLTIVNQIGNAISSLSFTDTQILITLPRNTVAPAITGNNYVGQTLSCSTGTWDGSGLTYTYQWYAFGSAISGATNSTYILTANEAGNFANVRCIVTVTYLGLSYTSNSNTITQIIDNHLMAYSSAIGGMSSNNLAAWNDAVILLKSSGCWSKCSALYPFEGATASSCKFNLMNPLDSDSAFRLIFNGGWTFSANGITPNGTNAYADTKWIPSSRLAGINSGHFSLFISINPGTSITAREIGCASGINSSFFGVVNNGSSSGGSIFRENASENIAAGGASLSTLTGMWMVSRNTSTSIFCLNRRVLVSGGSSASSGSRPSISAYIGAVNSSGTAGFFGTKTYGFASIGEGFTVSEALAFNDIIHTVMVKTGKIS